MLTRVTLPPPRDGDRAQVAIASPCPVRSYDDEQLGTEHVGQLLWVAHTITGGRERNSIGPLILYACWADGVWRYHPKEHCLTRHLDGDVRRTLADAALNRWFIARAPCVFVASTVPRRSLRDRLQQYTCYSPVEVGRAVERMFLQCSALGLAGVPVSEFDSAKVKHLLVLSRQEEPLCLLPVGWPDREQIAEAA